MGRDTVEVRVEKNGCRYLEEKSELQTDFLCGMLRLNC